MAFVASCGFEDRLVCIDEEASGDNVLNKTLPCFLTDCAIASGPWKATPRNEH